MFLTCIFQRFNTRRPLTGKPRWENLNDYGLGRTDGYNMDRPRCAGSHYMLGFKHGRDAKAEDRAYGGSPIHYL